MSNLSSFKAGLTEAFNTSKTLVRYGGVQLKPRPFVGDLGMNPAYKNTDAPRDGIKRWRVVAHDPNLVKIDAAVALQDYEFGRWELSEDCGQTWIKCFLDEPPITSLDTHHIILGRGFTDANLTINYQVGDGSFTTVDGNPTEASSTETVYASVSQGRNRSQLLENLGGDPSTQIYLEGFFTDINGGPVDRPDGLILQRPHPATIAIGSGEVAAGTFTPVLMSQSAWSANEQRRGTTCKGLFRSTAQ